MTDHGSGQLSVSVRQVGPVWVVAPAGDVDLIGSPTLRQELKRVQGSTSANSPLVVVDLSAVPYMDSSGVATLVEAMQTARRTKTRLVLCGLTDRVRSIFQIAKLETVFTIKPTLVEATVA